MKPSRLLLRLLLLCLLLATLPLALRIWHKDWAEFATLGWWLTGLALAMVAAFDASRRRHCTEITLTRHWPESLSVGVGTAVEIELRNRGSIPLYIELREDAPISVEVLGLTPTLTLPAGATVRLRYELHPQLRGDLQFGPLWLLLRSRWQLWELRTRIGKPVVIKVYPNFAAISHFASIGIDAQIGAMGIHLQQRRGEGSDFRQLRSFREGDALRQIDWKATARYQKPISREYQEERDQDVIFLLDCGRRMRTLDGELSHFDHALNAVLLTGYVALRQGDAVGLMTFAGSDRWLPPVKSQSSINRLIKQVYDLHSSTATSDFVQAAQALLNRHRKRALVILVSDVRDEDADDLRAACRLLSDRHLLVVASLREAFLDTEIQQPVHTFEDALGYSGTALYKTQREERLQRLRHGGIIVVDCPPQRLHTDLVAQYLLMKRSGMF